MGGWKEVKIKDLGQVVTGNTPPRKQPELYGKHTLFIKPTDINIGEKYCREPEECYSEKGFHKYKKSLIPKNATCVVTIGSIGKKMIKSHTDLFINQAMNAIIPNENYDEDFIFYLLKLNLFQLKTFDSGTASGRENVSKSSFSNIKISVPKSKGTQRKIASILSDYDDLIENNLKRIKLLEEQAQQTYEEWFVRFKFPGYENVAFDEESGLPVGWEKVKLGKVIDFRVDNRGRNPKYYLDKGIPVLDNHLITNSPYVNLNNAKRFLDDELFDNFLRKYLEPNDVLITLVGTVGSLALAPKEKCAIIQNTIGLRCNILCNPYFLFLFLKFNKQSVLNNNRGSAQPSVKVGDLLSIKMNLPNTNLLDEFKKICKPIFDQINNLGSQNQHLKEARDILLPRLMSGMIDVDGLEVDEQLGMVAEENEKYN